MAGTIYFELDPGASRVTRVSHGDYTREFDGKWPQQATAEEWHKFLLPTGLFREVGAVREPPVQGSKQPSK